MSGLIQELFRANLYKANQGKNARLSTAIAVAIIFICGAYTLYVHTSNLLVGGTVLGIITAFGCWFAYRLVNWPRFAEFLITVESEMMKVSWPGKQEVIISTFVVLIVLAIIAVMIFVFDTVWYVLFKYVFQILP